MRHSRARARELNDVEARDEPESRNAVGGGEGTSSFDFLLASDQVVCLKNVSRFFEKLPGVTDNA
jgi:hypothetical protein